MLLALDNPAEFATDGLSLTTEVLIVSGAKAVP